MSDSNDSTLRLIRGDLRQTWPKLVLAGLFCQVLALAVLMPFTAFLIRLFLGFSGQPVATDLDLALMLTRPVGWIGLMVVGSVILTVAALELASLMVVGFGNAQGRLPSATQALHYVLHRIWRVLRFAGSFLARTVLLAAPFLLGAGLIYLFVLGEHDINFYLTEKPPAFLVAVGMVAALGIGFVAVFLPRLIGGLFGLPVLLFEDASPRLALREGARRTSGHGWTICGWIAGWAAVSFLVTAVANFLLLLLGRLLIPQADASFLVLLFALGFLLLVFAAVQLLAALFAVATLALVVVRLYMLLSTEQGSPEGWTSAVQRLAETPRSRSVRRTLVWTTVASMIFAVVVALQLLATARMETDMLVTAHRGASGSAPENTLAAVEQAIADRADWVEIDVQRTADDEVVVIHDRDLKRVGGVPLRVADATMADLAEIDIGSWFGPQYAGERVPTLAQVLDLCRNRAGVNIELKYYGPDPDLAPRVVEIVEAAGMADQIVVMSLKQSAVEQIQASRPTWRAGLLVALAAGDLTRLEFDFYAVRSSLAVEAFVRRSHRVGRQVAAWTVNDPLSMTILEGRGVDDLITDEPAIARSILEQLSELGVAGRLLLDFELLFGLQPRHVAPTSEGGDL